MMEKLALVQLHHLFTAILEARNEPTLAGIEAVNHIGLLLLQQLCQQALVPTLALHVTKELGKEALAVVIGIVYAQVYHPHACREGIERGALPLVGSDNDNLPIGMCAEPLHLVQQHTLHTTWIIQRTYCV